MRILVRIFFKDYVVTAYLSDRLFLATGHILLKISSKISCARATPKYPFKFRLKSDDPCAPWIIRASSVDNLDCAPWKIDLSALCTLAKISLVSTRQLGISMKAWKTNSLPTTSME